MNISDFYTSMKEIIEQYIAKLSDEKIQDIKEKYNGGNKNMERIKTMSIKQKCKQFRSANKNLPLNSEDIELILKISPKNFKKLQMTSSCLKISRNDVINLLVEEFLV